MAMRISSGRVRTPSMALSWCWPWFVAHMQMFGDDAMGLGDKCDGWASHPLCGKRGLGDLHGDVLAANERMLKMCHDLGFEIAADPEDMTLRKVRSNCRSPHWPSVTGQDAQPARDRGPWSGPCAAL